MIESDIYTKYFEKTGMTEKEYTETFKKGYQYEFGYQALCPDNCEYLSITEAEQNTRPDKPDHICLKYNKRVKHGPFHPKLIRCDECRGD